ncbi:hypothetical protein [Rhizobium wenxiniae]|uniref:Uncharacterized protein n=2 Tax=Rhizobium TaxID=379 RepID=A0A7X0D1P2_9HYPH|nr:hypothetical protein [Rhizobium wenxiniae]MBB6164652.1 hypothetical protein [Rhizobium wenxiniae]GGG06765.1 hypothetical protein GCM10010924_39380 [Rhizobium wenxiniae]
MAMKRVLPPTTDKHPDRFLQCQEAMAGAFADVATAAVKAGGNPEEVASAMVELADPRTPIATLLETARL